MIEFNIGNITGENIQIGKINKMRVVASLDGCYEELLKLINKHASLEDERLKLIHDLQLINKGDTESKKSAGNLLSFIKATGVNLFSTAVVKALEVLAES